MYEPSALAIDGCQLRAWKAEDAEVLVRAWQDPAVMAWNPVPNDPSLHTATSWIGGVADRCERRISFDWAIDSFTAGGVVGEVGVSGFQTNHRGALIGYWLLEPARGRGTASAAVIAVTEWAHAALDLDMIVARCHVSNVASQAVAARAGYLHERSDSTGHQLWVSRRTVPTASSI